MKQQHDNPMKLSDKDVSEFAEDKDIQKYFSTTFDIKSKDKLTKALQDSNTYYFVIQGAQKGGENLLLHRMTGNFFLEVDGEMKKFLSSEHYYQYMKVITAIEKTTQNEILTSLWNLKANIEIQPLLAAAAKQNKSPNDIAVALNRQPLPFQGTCVNNLLTGKWYQDKSTNILHQGLLAQFRDPRNIEKREILFERTANKHIIVFLPNKEGNPTLARLAINAHKGNPGKHLLAKSLRTIKRDEEVLKLYKQNHSAATTQNNSHHPSVFTQKQDLCCTKNCLTM
jgi:predicted NAD-dependent protein-ADP-ribosyltransferase YbiA (DUF1768 family)